MTCAGANVLTRAGGDTGREERGVGLRHFSSREMKRHLLPSLSLLSAEVLWM